MLRHTCEETLAREKAPLFVLNKLLRFTGQMDPSARARGTTANGTGVARKIHLLVELSVDGAFDGGSVHEECR